MPGLKPFGKNAGRYCGQTINIKNVIEELRKLANKLNWQEEIFFKREKFDFIGIKKLNSSRVKNIYISSGIHGDEPAGVVAILKIIKEDLLPPNFNYWICPCLNPLGFTLNTRENERGIDLNRDYKNHKTPEVSAHKEWLDKQPAFDLSLCLHEDWESPGFYILEAQDQGPRAKLIIKEVEKIFPINTNSIIEGFPANNGVVSPRVNFDERPDWPEAFYLMRVKGGEHYTFEAASDYPLEARVEALVKATRVVVENLEVDIDRKMV